MKILVGLLAFLNSLPLLAQTTLEERLSKLEEKVEEAEIERSFQRLKFSGTFIGLAESLNTHFKDPSNGIGEDRHAISVEFRHRSGFGGVGRVGSTSYRALQWNVCLRSLGPT